MRQAGTSWNEFLANKGKKFPEIKKNFFSALERLLASFLYHSWQSTLSTTSNVCGYFYIFQELKLFFCAFCYIWVGGQLKSNDLSVNGMNNGSLAAAPYSKDGVCVWGGGVKAKFTDYCGSL